MKQLITTLIFLSITTLGLVANSSYDFTKGKKIEPAAGAWRSEDYRNLKFFFKDGTVLYFSFGETAVGQWKFVEKEKGIISYDWKSPEGQILGAWLATIKEDKLIEDQGDYTNTSYRLPIDRGIHEEE